MKQPKTTYNEQETTYNNLNLPTTSKTNNNEQNNQQRADFEIILQYGTIGYPL